MLAPQKILADASFLLISEKTTVRRPTSGHGKKAISQSDYSSYIIWWRCYIKRYDQR